jgi:hypothetical protein
MAGLAGCAAIYAIGQGCNVLFQLLLLRNFGADGYGQIGLSHLAFLLVFFVGDLGYATVFLRETPTAVGWERQWRLALGHKFMVTLGLYAATLAGWALAYGRGTEGFAYLAATVPAGLIGLVSPAPALLAQQRRMASFLVQQIPWPAALLFWWLVGGANGSALHAGLIVSAGFAMQPIVSLLVGGRLRLLLPAFGSGGTMLGASVKLSVMGITGALHDRLTPFLIARLAPDFLPLMLILGHGMNGASGILTQVNRLLLPQMSTRAGLLWSYRLVTILLLGMATLFQLFLLITAATADGGASLHLPLLLPTVMAWGFSLVGSVLANELIGRHRETQLIRIVLIGLTVSSALQILGTAGSSADGVLWARTICSVGMAVACFRLCGIVPGVAGWALCGSLVLAALAATSHAIWALSVLLFAGATVAVVSMQPLMLRQSSALAENLRR